jgi:uncharacterized protein
MKAMNFITLVLIIIGGINWGLLALLQYDLVVALFGGQDAALGQIIALLMGLSALWQLYPLTRIFQTPEVPHQRYRA